MVRRLYASEIQQLELLSSVWWGEGRVRGKESTGAKTPDTVDIALREPRVRTETGVRPTRCGLGPAPRAQAGVTRAEWPSPCRFVQ